MNVFLIRIEQADQKVRTDLMLAGYRPFVITDDYRFFVQKHRTLYYVYQRQDDGTYKNCNPCHGIRGSRHTREAASALAREIERTIRKVAA